MIYQTLKFILGIGIQTYYKEIKVNNKGNIPKKGPLLIVANHPNTLMDAWMVAFILKRPLHFMAKATFFNTPAKRWLLKKLKLVPIVRKGDKKVDVINNHDSLEESYKILENKDVLLIFPEGTSYPERRLRPLKTGAARIAIESCKRNEFDLPVKILPVGINYTDGHTFRSKILIEIGNVISIQDYKSEIIDNERKTVTSITNEIQERLEKLIVITEDQDQDTLVKKMEAFLILEGEAPQGILDKENVDSFVFKSNVILIKLKYLKENNIKKYNLLNKDLILFNKYLDKLNLSNSIFFFKNNKINFLKISIVYFIPFIIGSTVYIYGLINNFIPYRVVNLITKKITKEVEYYSSVRTIFGLILFPIYYLILTIIFYQFTKDYAYLVLYIFSMPLTGYFALNYGNWVSITKKRLRFFWLWYTKNELIKKLLKKRMEILKILTE